MTLVPAAVVFLSLSLVGVTAEVLERDRGLVCVHHVPGVDLRDGEFIGSLIDFTCRDLGRDTADEAGEAARDFAMLFRRPGCLLGDLPSYDKMTRLKAGDPPVREDEDNGMIMILLKISS